MESLVIAGYVRGLSIRDVEASLADALGPEATLSKSTASRICAAIRDEFDAWRRRDLSAVELEYLYLDGSHFRYHDGARAEPGAVRLGYHQPPARRCFWPWMPPAASRTTPHGVRTRACRSRAPPLLAITDSAPGLIGAVERVYAHSLRQRVRNVTNKVSDGDRDQVKADFWAIVDPPDAVEPGDAAVVQARRRADAFAAKWQAKYPGAVACVLDDLASLTTFLRFPREHGGASPHQSHRTTFGESRRRVKVIGRLPGERSCLSLVWAVLDRASRGWRGVDMNPTNVRLLQQLRADLFRPHDTTLQDVTDLSETVPAVA